MTDTLRLTLNPKGLWRRQRFEFCNALEAVVDKPKDAKAVAELERLGGRIMGDDGGESPGNAGVS
jgi:hypothetical protein